MRRAVVAQVVALAVVTAFACAPPPTDGEAVIDEAATPAIGAATLPEPPDPDPPPLELRDARDAPFDPIRAEDAAATVFVFARSDCPISNRYAPEIRRIASEFEPRGVAFWLVYADPDETVESVEAHRREYDFGVPFARDVHHDLVRWTDATITPEAVVFVPSRGVVYRGRIDDRYLAFGRSRQAPRTSDLVDVLERTLAGDPPEFYATDAVGCAIRRSS